MSAKHIWKKFTHSARIGIAMLATLQLSLGGAVTNDGGGDSLTVPHARAQAKTKLRFSSAFTEQDLRWGGTENIIQ